ncbi:virulence RhuM family protein [Candidatus Nomurabacteria bacterium]|nr:virulence RhuM family protein [Candidatus Kaiserbacteria bacterium]MCB9814286.1 virulence RhuM family protein [Candidatus Nomurabacteria bacterium]
MNKQEKQAEIVIFTSSKGQVKLRGDFHNETLWATQAEIADVFGVERSVITKHIRNVFKDGELDKNAVCANFAHTANDGKTYQVQGYNLDIILSVGYRTNSKVAIEFRKWATATLRQHITTGFTINPSRVTQNYEAFMAAVEKTKSLLPAGSVMEARTLLEAG